MNIPHVRCYIVHIVYGINAIKRCLLLKVWSIAPSEQFKNYLRKLNFLCVSPDNKYSLPELGFVAVLLTLTSFVIVRPNPESFIARSDHWFNWHCIHLSMLLQLLNFVRSIPTCLKISNTIKRSKISISDPFSLGLETLAISVRGLRSKIRVDTKA